jgi:large subunit ribosomal protein L4
MPKKMRSGAIRSALSVRLRAGELLVLEAVPHIDKPSTKRVRQLIDQIAVGQTRLVVLAGPHDAFRLSARNLPGVRVITTDNLSTYDLMRHARVIVTLDAARYMEGRLGLAEEAGEEHDHAGE